jgi:PAS domain S-box-containing protein
MTIARILWLGFGLPILLFLLAGLIIFFSQRSIQGAADEMEINSAEISRDVLSYLDTGDQRYREQFADDRADFERAKASFGELVDTPTGREHAARVDSIYGEYVAVGESLIDRRDEAEGVNGSIQDDVRRFDELEMELNDVLDEEVQPWAEQQLVEAESDVSTAIRNVYVIIVALILAGILVAILAAALISRNIIDSIVKLKEGADRIGRGEMDHRIDVDTSDELGAVASAFNDMLDRRREANAALYESEERFRRLSDATFEGIVMSENGRVVDANRAFAEMFGYDLSEVVGLSVRDLIAPESLDLVLHNISSDAQETYEAVAVRKDATRFDVEIRGRASSYQGRTVRIAALSDMTERKRAEVAVRENEERFRQLFNQSVDALFVHDASGVMVDCNDEAGRSLGYDREELLSIRIQDLATDLVSDREERPATEPTLWQRALLGEPGKVAGVHRGEHRRKDGTTFPVEVYVGSVDYGGERMIFASARDVTERVRAEKALRESEEQYRRLIETVQEGIASISAEGGIIDYCNESYAEILGLPPDELVGKSFFDFLDDEEILTAYAACRRLAGS